MIRNFVVSDEKIERTIQRLSGMQLEAFYGRACTPKNKRSRNSVANDEDVDSPDDEDAKDSSCLRDMMDEWERRGKRQRLELGGNPVDEGVQPEAVRELKEYLQEVF